MRAGMLIEALAPLLFCLFAALLLGGAPCANSLPIQYLPEIPGYIPVYIRYGNQPLEEVHPALAEAFNEPRGTFENIEKSPSKNEIRYLKLTKDLTDRNDVFLKPKIKNAKLPTLPRQLFYSIPEKKDNFGQKTKPSGREAVVMKIARPTYPEKIDKILKKESKHKEASNS